MRQRSIEAVADIIAICLGGISAEVMLEQSAVADGAHVTTGVMLITDLSVVEMVIVACFGPVLECWLEDDRDVESESVFTVRSSKDAQALIIDASAQKPFRRESIKGIRINAIAVLQGLPVVRVGRAGLKRQFGVEAVGECHRPVEKVRIVLRRRSQAREETGLIRT